MKIISGSLKGRNILTTDDNSYRPTTGRVKEAIFSILSGGQFEGILKDAVTIDLFGGTGALTFEAISRGATKGIIIENNAQNLKALDLNAKRLGIAVKRVRSSHMRCGFNCFNNIAVSAVY